MMQQKVHAASPVHEGCRAAFTAALLVLALVGHALAQSAGPLAQLEGRWTAQGQPPFVMEWSMRPAGFALRWTLPNGDETMVEFTASDQPGVFAATTSGWSMFGGGKTVNPLVGGTLYWARSTPDAVYVYSLVIDDRGAFVLDRYACQPSGDRLEVALQRRLPEGRVEDHRVTLVRAEG